MITSFLLWLPCLLVITYVVVCAVHVVRGHPRGWYRNAPVVTEETIIRPIPLQMSTIYASDGETQLNACCRMGALEFHADGTLFCGNQLMFLDGEAIDIDVRGFHLTRPAGLGEILKVTDDDGEQLRFRYLGSTWVQLAETKAHGPAYETRALFALRGTRDAILVICVDTGCLGVIGLVIFPLVYFAILFGIDIAKYLVWLIGLSD
jgi:hypothetical protein